MDAKENAIVIRRELDNHGSEIQQAIGTRQWLDAGQMSRCMWTEVMRDPKLLSCSPRSIVMAVLQCTIIGLYPGAALGHVYPVPFGNQCQVIIGYKGMIELIVSSGAAKAIYAEAVFGDDDYSVIKGTSPKIVHKPQPVEAGEIRDYKNMRAVYAVAVIDETTNVFAEMSRAEVEKIRDGRKGKGGFSPWSSHPIEMAKKTVIRALCKTLPKMPKPMVDHMLIEDRIDCGVAPETAHREIIDAEIDFDSGAKGLSDRINSK